MRHRLILKCWQKACFNEIAARNELTFNIKFDELKRHEAKNKSHEFLPTRYGDL